MVGKICTVCKQCSVVNKNLSFFTYPGDRQRRYEWLKAVDRLDLFEKLVDNKSRGNHRICEAHFQDSFIKKCKGLSKSRKCLTKDAFPSLQHVNRGLCNIDKSKGQFNIYLPEVDDKCKSKTINTPKGKTKMDRTTKFVSVDMDSNAMITTTQNKDPISETLIPMDIIKTEKVDDECGENPASPQFATPEMTGFADMSQFCESVIKVCKETQTPLQEAEDWKKTKKRKLDPTETIEYFLQTCSKNLPKGMVQLVKWQINTKENIDNYKFHMFALNLYFSGANAYTILKDMMGLPAIDAIKKLFIPRTTKFNNNLINVLKIKVDNMSSREKLCSVSIGSMQLKPNLYYDIKHDKVEGFHEIDGVQKIELAKYALVFIVQGILEKWSQPIAYAFVSRYEHLPDISIWVEEIITLLIDVGLDVRAFVSDPKTELLYMLESQRVTPEQPYFSINNKNIYYIYDTAQLQKSVRGYIKSCNFLIAGTSADCCDNTEFTRKFNNLCNFLNSTSHVTMNPFKRAYSDRKYQSRFLKGVSAMFQNLKVVRKADGLQIKNMKFINRIQITIISVMQLFEDLKKAGAKSLLTGRLTQNCLDKFFSKVNSESKSGCSCRQLRHRFAKCFVYNMLKKPIGDRKGCSAQVGFSPQYLLSIGKAIDSTIKVGTTDYRQALPEKKRFDMVCRYLYLKCIDYHSCDTFKDFLSRSPESRMYVAPYRSSAPLDIKNCKLIPPRHFTEFIMILEKRFRDYCKQDVKISSIGHQILKKISSFEFETPCKCFPLEYLKKLFVRLRIFYVVRENNVAFKKDADKLFSTFNL